MSEPTTDVVRGRYSDGAIRQGAPDDDRHLEDFDRWHAEELRKARAAGLREAADIASSQAAEEWRLDRGEGMPGGISKIGSEQVAKSLDMIAKIIRDRADREEQGDE